VGKIMKFKVGDIVEIINPKATDYGFKGTVTVIHTLRSCYNIRVEAKDLTRNWYAESELNFLGNNNLPKTVSPLVIWLNT
jgi:hypothetical protein